MSTIQTKHIYRIDLAHAPLEVRLESPLTHQDAQADTFTAILRQGMIPLNLNGMSVKGFLTLERQKQTLPLEGTADVSEASLTLTSACYAQPGPFTLTMQVLSGGVRHTVLHVRGCIARSAAGTITDPDDVIPTLSELLGEIDQMREATQAARSAADEADAARLGIDSRLDEFRSDVYTPLDVIWEQGGLHTSYGTHYANTARSRTRWLPAKLLGYVRTSEDFAAAVYAYDAALTFLGMTSWESFHAISSVMAAFPDAAHLRINLKALDERDLTPAEAAPNAVIAGIDAAVLAEKMDCTEDLMGGLFTPIPLEDGGLYADDGTESNSFQRLRTAFIPVDEFALARCDGNYQCLYMAYRDGVYLSNTDWEHGPITPRSIRATHPDATHVRLLLRASINRTLVAEEANADPGILILRSEYEAQQKANAATAEEIAAIVADTVKTQQELAAKIAAITNDGSKAHSLLEEKIASATDGAAKARAVIEARIAAAEAAASKTHAELDKKIDDTAIDSASTAQLLTSMLAAIAAQVGKAAKSDGVTASLGMYDRIGIVGASWDSGYIYTSHTDTIEEERLSWPRLLAMRRGFTHCNYAYHGVGAKDWLAHAKCGVKMLADAPCDLYVCTLGGNDMRKRGTAYLGSLTDITGYTSADQYPSTFFGDYGRIIESIRSHAPSARILLIFWYSPTLHDPEGDGRQKYFKAVQAIAEHYGLPYLNWGEDAWYDSVNDNQLGAHPTAVQLGGISYSFERLYSIAADRFYRYFCHYPEPAPAHVPMESNLSDTLWIPNTGNGYSTGTNTGMEMLVRLNTNVTGIFATKGQGTPLRGIDTQTWELEDVNGSYYPISVPTYAKALHVEAPAGCELRLFTSILKDGVWNCLKMYDWGGNVQTIDLTSNVADGVSVNLRNGTASQVRIWFE